MAGVVPFLLSACYRGNSLALAWCRFHIRQAAKAVIHTGATSASFSCNGSTLAAWHEAKVDVYHVQGSLETGNAVVVFSWDAPDSSAIAQVSDRCCEK